MMAHAYRRNGSFKIRGPVCRLLESTGIFVEEKKVMSDEMTVLAICVLLFVAGAFKYFGRMVSFRQ
jgi:hypothetical protein